MGEFAIGQSLRRREDPRLLRGNGRYFDDLKLADQLFAAIVRSQHAHADIRGIDAAEATTEHPGLAVPKILFLAMVDVMSGTILHF
jgi:carbon-monoxide dehydrogenase large subunit